MSINDDLRAKIAEAKARFPLPSLLHHFGLSNHAKKTARCPFPGHEDKHPSFSIFKGDDDLWKFKCHSACDIEGDELTFVSKWKSVPLAEAITLYLDIAGFPRAVPAVSREYPKSLRSCVSASPVSLVSEGQGDVIIVEQKTKALAARNACMSKSRPEKRRFKLARDLAALEQRILRQLTMPELRTAASEWHHLSQLFLDPSESAEDHFMALVAELEKVRFPTGEGTIKEAVDKVSRLPLAQLPSIPGDPEAREQLRRIAALHCELWRVNGAKQYFLSYRDAIKVVPGMSPGQAHHQTKVLERCKVIKIMSKGRAGLNSDDAAEFLYLLSLADDDGDALIL